MTPTPNPYPLAERRARPESITHAARLRYFALAAVAALLALALAPEASVWLSVALLVYTYAGYPALLAVAAAIRKQEEPPPFEPPVTVLIAAHNEEASIGQTIRMILQLDYPQDKLEVVVVSDGSTDRTNEILQSIGDPRVRSLALETQRGKTEAQNQGVKLCRGDIVVFCDATTIYDAQAIRRLARPYHDPRVGGVSGHYEYVRPNAGRPAVMGTAVFWQYENLVKLLQSRAGTMTGASGCIYSVRRDLYAPLAPEMCSDLVEPLAIVRQGYRVVFAPDALAFEETSATMDEEFRMRVRVAANGIDSIAANADLLNVLRRPWVALQLLSHKVLRWMTPLFLVNTFVMSGMLVSRQPYRILFAAQTCLYAAAAAAAWAPRKGRWRILGIPFQFCVLQAAVVVAAAKLIAGRAFTVWTPERTLAPRGRRT